MLCHADKIISVSNYTKQQLIEVNGVNANKIEVLPNCLDPFFTANFKQQYPKGKVYYREVEKALDYGYAEALTASFFLSRTGHIFHVGSR